MVFQDGNVINLQEDDMKVFGSMILALILAVVFSACQKTIDPVSPNPGDKIDFISGGLANQAFIGTFEVTMKNYRNTDRTVTISGTIEFVFGRSTYTYNAKVINASADVTETDLHDKGTYTMDQNRITMSDDAAKLMNPGIMPSLYLSGVYGYNHEAAQSTIEGNGAFGSAKITLKAL
jgi:hypothetical protein